MNSRLDFPRYYSDLTEFNITQYNLIEISHLYIVQLVYVYLEHKGKKYHCIVPVGCLHFSTYVHIVEI